MKSPRIKKHSARSVKVSSSSQSSSRLLNQTALSRSKKAALRARDRANVTQAKKYLLYAVFCYLSTRLIKFLVYSVFFRGEETPSGIGFLLVVYLQTGLLLASVVLILLATYKALQRIFSEI